MKRKIRLTESQLHQVIKESVRNVLKESEYVKMKDSLKSQLFTFLSGKNTNIK